MTGRFKTCQKILEKNKISTFLVSDFHNIGYLSGFFPLSPQEREVFLLLTNGGLFLLTDSRYIHEAKAQVTGFTCLEVNSRQNFFQTTSKICQNKNIKKLAFEKGNLTVAEYEQLKRELKNCNLLPTQKLVEKERSIKETQELDSIKKACQIADQTFSYLLGFLKPGLTEKEVADEIEWFIRKKACLPVRQAGLPAGRGAYDLSFDPMAASGENSSFPHHRTSDRRLKTRDIILLDFGAKVENYCSDMTRVVFLGKATAEQKKVYQTVLDAQKRALERLSSAFKHLGGGRMDSSEVEFPRIKAREIERVARSYILSHGYPPIPHGLGHGVGLSEHEAPRLSTKSKDVLQSGMVFSVEPGIYLPGKFGVRIEDLVVLEKTDFKILTQSPKEIIEL